MATPGSSPPASLSRSTCAQPAMSPPHHHYYSTQCHLLHHQGLKPDIPNSSSQPDLPHGSCPRRSHPNTRHPQLTVGPPAASPVPVALLPLPPCPFQQGQAGRAGHPGTLVCPICGCGCCYRAKAVWAGPSTTSCQFQGQASSSPALVNPSYHSTPYSQQACKLLQGQANLAGIQSTALGPDLF